MFNPNTISDSGPTPVYAEQSVPGISFPTTQYAGGGSRRVSFDIYLDGDRGQRRNRPQNRINTALAGVEPERNPKDITDDIKFYQSLCVPLHQHQESASIERQSPALLLLTMGTMYQSFPCILTRAPVTMTKFTKNMEPLMATINLELIHKPSFSETRQNYFVPVR